MALLKNTASQSLLLYAYNITTGAALAGDEAQITCKIDLDAAGSYTGTTTANPTALESGFYSMPLTQAETNGDIVDAIAVSSTGSIQVIVYPGPRQYTSPTLGGITKNESGQKWLAYAYDSTTGSAKTGDAANISGKIRKDYGSLTALGTAAPAELESGYYTFTLAQAETDADVLDLVPVSATANIVVIAIQPRQYVIPLVDTGISLAKLHEMMAAWLAGITSTKTQPTSTTSKLEYLKQDDSTVSFSQTFKDDTAANSGTRTATTTS